MKITKITVSVFFLAFLIGYVSVPQTKRISLKTQVDVPKSLPIQPIETKPALETIEEIDNRPDDENKYPFKIKLLETGEGFHGDEVKAKSGEIWLGLFSENGKHYLKFTKIQIRRVHDAVVDGYEEKYAKQKTGKTVSVKSRNKPIFLLKDANVLGEGEVATLFRGITWNEVLENEDSSPPPDETYTSLTKDFTQEYEIGGKEYKLYVIEAKNKESERILALILESHGVKQVLHTMNVNYDSGLGTLYWVGDLDRDEKPDFYFDLYAHENVENRVLFLSSKAGKGKLVKTAAYFWTTGC